MSAVNNSTSFDETLSRISEAMNAYVRELKESGAQTFESLPVGRRFVFVTFPDVNPRRKVSPKRYSDGDGRGKWEVGPRTLVREMAEVSHG